jgi:hypothetical protein
MSETLVPERRDGPQFRFQPYTDRLIEVYRKGHPKAAAEE